jgi:hypothetical protein
MAAPVERDGVETRGAGAERTLGDATLGAERNDGVLGAERNVGAGVERMLGVGDERNVGVDEGLGPRYAGVAAMLGDERNDGGGEETLGEGARYTGVDGETLGCER